MMEVRTLRLLGAAGPIRKEMLENREHIVVPVVALVEGVLQAVNAPTPELVLAQAFSTHPGGWNGRPVFVGHPMVGRTPVSGNSPEVLTTAIGKVFNTRVDGKRLLMEAWIDPIRAKEVGQERMIERLLAGHIVEISTGAFVTTSPNGGRWNNGKEYKAVWEQITPDHLALLPEGTIGACSVDAGCGVRAAQAYRISENGYEPVEESMKHMYAEWLEPGPETDELLRTLRDIPQAERDKLSKKDFAGPNQSFPIQKPEDVSAAASSIGRAKGGPAARAKIKAKIIAIAYRRGAEFVAKLPDDWKRKADQKNSEGFKGLLARLLALATTEEMSDVDVRQEIMDALMEKEPRCSNIVAVYPSFVIYSVWGDGDYCYYQRDYSMSADGEATVADTRTEVEQVTTWEPVEADEVMAAQHAVAALVGKSISSENLKKVQSMHDNAVALGATCTSVTAAQSSTCGCGARASAAHATGGNEDMDKKTRVKALIDHKHSPFAAGDETMLEGMTDERLTALEQNATAAEKTANDLKVAQEVAAKPAQQLTEEQFLATAPQSIRDLVASKKADDAREKTALVTALKAAQTVYSEEKLNAMSIDALKDLAQLAQVRSADVDFGLLAPRANASGDGKDVYANPPDAYADGLKSMQSSNTKH